MVIALLACLPFSAEGQVYNPRPKDYDWDSPEMKARTRTAVWAAAPSQADLAAAYPQALRQKPVDGYVLLYCKMRVRDGAAERCRVLSETPEGQGLGAAALGLTKYFRAGAEILPRVYAGRIAQEGYLPISFPAGLVSNPEKVVGLPHPGTRPSVKEISTVLPDGTTLETMNGRANVNCRVVGGGALADCKVTAQEPYDFGYGDAALGLSPLFRYSLWSHDGLPTLGARISLPIIFRLSEKGPRPKK